MKNRLIIGLFVGLLGMMGRTSSAEVLPKADGKVSATELPLDARLAKVKYETATFGLG